MAKYYKKVVIEKAWTQPVATDSVGGSSFGVQVSGTYSGSATNLFDKDNSTYWDGGGPRPTWFTFYNPNPIKVSRIQTYSNYSSWTDTNVTITASNDNSTWKTLATITLSQANTQNWDIPVDKQNYYKYYRYTSNSGGASSNPFNEVYITATQQTETWQECTKAEYDNLPADQRKIVTDIYNGFVRKKYLNKKKIIETAWTQPVLTSDGTLGGNNFAVQMLNNPTNPAWQAFNDSADGARISSGANTDSSYTMYNPNPLKISKIVIDATGHNNNEYMRSGNLYGSNNGTNWTLIKSFSGLSYSASTITVNSDAFYKYHKIQPLTFASTGYWFMKSITITATQQTRTWQECTKEEYDQLPNDQRKIIDVYNGFVRKKYLNKKTVEKAWTRPNLTENGTLGGGDFAVASYNWNYYSDDRAWYAVDDSSLGSGTQILSSAFPCDYIFYNPNSLKVSKLNITNRQAGDNWTTRGGVVYGSNDNVNWTQLCTFENTTATGASGNFDILVNSNTAYKYHKITITTHYGYGCSIANLAITAKEYIEKWQECTKAEYDQLPDDQRKIVTDIYNGSASVLTIGKITITATEQVKQLVPV